MMYTAFVVAVGVVVVAGYSKRLKKKEESVVAYVVKSQRDGIKSVLVGACFAVLVPNVVAGLMQRVLGKGLSWFSDVYAPVGLFGVPAVLGVFFLVFTSRVWLVDNVDRRAAFSTSCQCADIRVYTSQFCTRRTVARSAHDTTSWDR